MFYDEDVKLPENQRLLRRCLDALRRLSQGAPVIVSARPPKPIVLRRAIGLLEQLRAAARALWEEEFRSTSQSPPTEGIWAGGRQPKKPQEKI